MSYTGQVRTDAARIREKLVSRSRLDPLRSLKHRAIVARRETAYRFQRLRDSAAAMLSRSSVSGVDHVVISTDLNPDYLFCLPICVLFWNRICGVTPIVVAVGSAAEWKANPLASLVLRTLEAWGLEYELLHVPQSPHLASGQQAQVLRLWAPTQFPEAFSILGDVDMLPLNPSFFRLHRNPRYEVYLLNGDAYHPRERWCMCYVGATGTTWREMIGSFDGEGACRYFGELYQRYAPGYDPQTGTVPGGFAWDVDETILSVSLQRWRGYPEACRVYNCYRFSHRRRFNGTEESWRAFDERRVGWYIDGHLARQCFLHWDAVAPVIGAYVPAALNSVNRYVDLWKSCMNARHEATHQPLAKA